MVRPGTGGGRRRDARLPLLAGQRTHLPGLDPNRPGPDRRRPRLRAVPPAIADRAFTRSHRGSPPRAGRRGGAPRRRPLGPHRASDAHRDKPAGLPLPRNPGDRGGVGRASARGSGPDPSLRMTIRIPARAPVAFRVLSHAPVARSAIHPVAAASTTVARAATRTAPHTANRTPVPRSVAQPVPAQPRSARAPMQTAYSAPVPDLVVRS